MIQPITTPSQITQPQITIPEQIRGFVSVPSDVPPPTRRGLPVTTPIQETLPVSTPVSVPISLSIPVLTPLSRAGVPFLPPVSPFGEGGRGRGRGRGGRRFFNEFQAASLILGKSLQRRGRQIATQRNQLSSTPRPRKRRRSRSTRANISDFFRRGLIGRGGR